MHYVYVNKEYSSYFDFLTSSTLNDEFCHMFTIPQDFIYTKGHFPQFPVVPAFSMIEISIRLCEKVRIKTKKLIKSKFNHPVFPEDLVQVQIKLSDSSVYITWFVREIQVAHLNFLVANLSNDIL